MKIRPDPKCKDCKGEGIIYDQEEFWGAPCTRESFCLCVLSNIPENTPDDEPIEIDYSEMAEIEGGA